MNKQEAIQLLAVAENASNDDIKAKYAELYNEYQIRLTNAPTPNLKKLYQKNLQELNEALTFLLEGKTSGVINDLPSSSPVFESETNNTPKETNFAQSTAQSTKPKNEVPNTKPKTPKGIYIFAIIATLAIATVILLIILLNQKNEKLANYENKSVASTVCDKYMQNGKLKVKNVGIKPIYLGAITVCYLDKDNQMKKIEKRMDVLIPAGEVIDDVFTEINGGKVLWDGSVISFSFMIGNDEIESMLYGGMWAENINNEIPLNLDNL
jgi:hypothetical protein